MRDLLAALDNENRNIYQTRDVRLIPSHIIRFKSCGVRPSSSTSPFITSVLRGCWSNWSTARRSSRSTVSVFLRSICYLVTFPSCSILPDRLLATLMCRLVNNQARSSSSIKLSLYMYQAKPIQRMGKNRSIKLKQASLIDQIDKIDWPERKA